MRMSSLLAIPGLFLAPIVSFAQTIVCTSSGGAIVCTDPPGTPGPSTTLPEHWDSFESLVFFALVLIAFWALVRLKVLRQNG